MIKFHTIIFNSAEWFEREGSHMVSFVAEEFKLKTRGTLYILGLYLAKTIVFSLFRFNCLCFDRNKT